MWVENYKTLSQAFDLGLLQRNSEENTKLESKIYEETVTRLHENEYFDQTVKLIQKRLPKQ